MRRVFLYLLLIFIISHIVLCTEKDEIKTRRRVIKENSNPAMPTANQCSGTGDECDGAWESIGGYGDGSRGSDGDPCGGDSSDDGDSCSGAGRGDDDCGEGGSYGGKGSCKGAAEMLEKGNPKEKATNIAQKAAQEAKCANEAQIPAAAAAAQHVKIQLAEKAIQSARAAEAALAGKQQIVEQLQQVRREAEAVLKQVCTSNECSQKSVGIASQVISEARKQLSDLKNIVKGIACTLQRIEAIVAGARQEIAEKSALLNAAQKRLQCVIKQLEAARQDYEKTKQAAYKAACAAVEAKQKATSNRETRSPEMSSITKLYALYRHPRFKTALVNALVK